MTQHIHIVNQLMHLVTHKKNSDITKSEIEAKLTGEITSHSHALPNHTHTKSQITDFPTLATVATSGSYADLTINQLYQIQVGCYLNQVEH